MDNIFHSKSWPLNFITSLMIATLILTLMLIVSDYVLESKTIKKIENNAFYILGFTYVALLIIRRPKSV